MSTRDLPRTPTGVDVHMVKPVDPVELGKLIA